MQEAEVERYLAFLREPGGVSELGLLLASVAVHKTDLFRDGGQLEAFRTHVLLPLAQSEDRPLRVWSAGCATGEEVATLLLLLAASGAHPASTVLGTDLSEHALTQARALSFRSEFLARIPPTIARAFVVQQGSSITLTPQLQARARFAVHNLMDLPYPRSAEGPFDVVFCRNVLIYFTPEAAMTVVGRLAEALRPGGMLILSAAEPLLDEHPMLETVRLERAFFYRRRGASAHADPVLARARRRYAGSGGDIEANPPTLTSPSFMSSAAPVSPAPAPSTPVSSAPAYVGSRATAESPRARSSAEADAAPVAMVQDVLALRSAAIAPQPSPGEEAEARFEALLEQAALGAAPEETERALRHCLYLDPHFAQARYLLGMLLEQRGARADAANEYRRSLSALNDGSARAMPFFLNPDRLRHACLRALGRLGFQLPPQRV